MKFAESVIKYRRITYLSTISFVLLGIASWITMPKEEDPRLKNRYGFITVIYPGATANEVQAKVVDILSEKLQEIPEIKVLDTSVRSEFCFLNIDLADSLSKDSQVDEVWRDVRLALEDAQDEWPDGVLEPTLNTKAIDQEAMLYAVVGSRDVIELYNAAKKIKAKLLSISGVGQINIFGDPDKQISININEKKMKTLGLSFHTISQRLAASNQAQGSGSLLIDGKKVGLKANTQFNSLDELRKFPLYLDNGEFVELREIATIGLTSELPSSSLVLWNDQPAVAIGLVTTTNIDLIQVGKSVREAIGSIELPSGLMLKEVSFQPDYVESRLKELTQSLLTGMGIIAVVLLLAMGVRVGLFVSLLVPVVTITSLAFFAWADGILHQISIAAFVLSLGLLVDNIIVIVEGVQDKIDRGETSYGAAVHTINQFAGPLAAATMTTVASFFPLLSSIGPTADFTRSIPQVAILTLSLSYIFSVFATPVFSAWILKAKTQPPRTKETIVERFSGMITAKPLLTLTVAILLFAGTLPFAGGLKMQFFPKSDRDQVVVSIELPEGTHIDQTAKITKKLVAAINQHESVLKVTSFIGEGVPRFYYNIVRNPSSPHLAQLIVKTDSFLSSYKVSDDINKMAKGIVPEAMVISKILGQGPPVKADLEILLYSDNRESLAQTSDIAYAALRSIPGTVNVRSDIGVGVPKLSFNVVDNNAQRFGVSRALVNSSIVTGSRGLPISSYRKEALPMDIVLMSEQGYRNHPELLRSSPVIPSKTGGFVVEDFAEYSIDFEPAVLKSKNGRSVVRILAELSPGTGFNDVLPLFDQKMKESKNTPTDVEIEIGGASGESEAANRAILKVIPIGVLLLLASLLALFNSFSKVFIVLTTVPFIFSGVVIGLLLFELPFGFFSLLGSLALIGIVVNNAILLIDCADIAIKDGEKPIIAMKHSLVRRIRPIGLTTMTTIAGLLPLAMTQATLWPPFAISVIFGLLASSLFSILVVPSLYILIYSRIKPKIAGIAFALLIPIPDQAEAAALKSLNEVVSESIHSEQVKIAGSQLEVSKFQEEVQSSAAYYPKVGVSLSRDWLDTKLESEGPFGTKVPGPPVAGYTLGAGLVQPLYSYKNMKSGVRTAELARKAAFENMSFVKMQMAYSASQRYLAVIDLKVQLDSISELKSRLEARKAEVKRLLILGRVSDLDLAKVDLAIRDLTQSENDLDRAKVVSRLALGRSVGKELEIDALPLEEYKERILALEIDSVSFSPRADSIALQHESERLKEEAEALSKDWYPEVSLSFNHYYLDPSSYTDKNWSEIKLQLSSVIWGGGTRAPQKKAILSRRKQTNEQRNYLEKEALFQRSKAKQDFLSATERIFSDFKSLELAEAALKKERTQYRNGRTSFNNVLDGEILLRDRKLAANRALIAKLEAYLSYQFYSGQFPKVP